MAAKTFNARVSAAGAWLKNLARARNGSRAHLALLAGGGVAVVEEIGGVV